MLEYHGLILLTTPTWNHRMNACPAVVILFPYLCTSFSKCVWTFFNRLPCFLILKILHYHKSLYHSQDVNLVPAYKTRVSLALGSWNTFSFVIIKCDDNMSMFNWFSILGWCFSFALYFQKRVTTKPSEELLLHVL